MTAVAFGQRQDRGSARWPAALGTFLVFAVAGPPIGGALLLGSLIALDAVPPGFAGWSLNAYVFAIATVALPVLAAGAVLALYDARSTPAGITLASGLGATVAATWGLFLAAIGAAAALSILAFVGSVVAVLACWRLTRWTGRAR